MSKAVGQCPDPSHRPAAQVVSSPQPIPVRPQESAPQPVWPRPQRPSLKAQAWLFAGDGHSYQLNLELTTVGRSSTSDIQITNDTTVSREHGKIVEQNGHFRLYDLGSTSGTRVNSRTVRQAVLLEPDDVIELGGNTRLQFVTSRWIPENIQQPFNGGISMQKI